MKNEIGCKMNNIDAIFSIDENHYVKISLCKFKQKFESISPFSTQTPMNVRLPIYLEAMKNKGF
jgi:hypothetical protein